MAGTSRHFWMHCKNSGGNQDGPQFVLCQLFSNLAAKCVDQLRKKVRQQETMAIDTNVGGRQRHQKLKLLMEMLMGEEANSASAKPEMACISSGKPTWNRMGMGRVGGQQQQQHAIQTANFYID